MPGITDICMTLERSDAVCGYPLYSHIPFDGSLGFWFRCVFSVMDYFPLIITIGKMSIGAIVGSVELYICGMALLLDAFLNYVLQLLFRQQGPRPCLVFDTYQMPALITQSVAFFVTGFVLFAIVYRREWGAYLLWTVYIMGFLATYKRVFDRINTPEQLVLGACVGFLDALIMHALLYYVLRKHVVRFCKTSVARLLKANNYCFHNHRALDTAECRCIERAREYYEAGGTNRVFWNHHSPLAANMVVRAHVE